MAIARVADRVRLGGHAIPEATIRRRYGAGLSNLRSIYLPLADTWKLIDNTGAGRSPVIAAGMRDGTTEVFLPQAWAAITERNLFQ
jgi:predicted ABC-type ATPase